MAWIRLIFIPGFPDFPRSPDFPKPYQQKTRYYESPFIPQIFLLSFLTPTLLFPATPTFCHTTIILPHIFPWAFCLSSHSKLDCQPQSFYSFVWGTFCLFLDGGERFECGRFGSWLGCVVSRRKLLRVAFQSRIELGFRCTSWILELSNPPETLQRNCQSHQKTNRLPIHFHRRSQHQKKLFNNPRGKSGMSNYSQTKKMENLLKDL